MKRVVLYTDGACHGNPGPGGYGVVLQFGEHRRELSGGFRLTTNNRMELYAAIVGLETLKEPCDVNLYTDSKYLSDAINLEWLSTWESNGWRTAKRKPVSNIDLWKRLLVQIHRHDVTFEWVEGHAGLKENEVCDRLASTAARSGTLPVDVGYLE